MSQFSREHLQALIRRHVAAKNFHKMADLLDTLHSQLVIEDVPLQRVFRGREGACEYYRMWWNGVSLLFSPTDHDRHAWTDDGQFMAESRFTGLHTGDFLGIPATGRRVDFRFAVIVSFRDGLLAGERLYYDLFGILRQLGVARTGARQPGTLTGSARAQCTAPGMGQVTPAA
jgi:hypothetical protein